MRRRSRRWFSSLVVSAVAVATLAFAGVASAEVLLQDDFSKGLGQWRVEGESPSWEVQGGALVHTQIGFGNVFAGSASWTDYTIEADITPLEFPQYASVRVFWRNQGIWTGYALNLFESGANVMRFDGNWDKNVVLARLEEPTQLNKLYKVKVVVKGNKFQIYLDGKLVMEAEDKDNVYPQGQVGFRADYSRVIIDNVKVTKE